MREDFEINYQIGDITKSDIKSLFASPTRQQYLLVALQMVNNVLRDIFISSLQKHNENVKKRFKIMLDLLENCNDKDINKTVIPYISSKQEYQANPIKNLDCFDNGFLKTLRTIDDELKSREHFEKHLLYNRVLPVNSLSDLICLLERTICVRDYIRHKISKDGTINKLPLGVFVKSSLHLICVLLIPSVSKQYVDKLKLAGFEAIWKHWSTKHRANMDIFLGLERSKKTHKKKISVELDEEALKKQYERINRDSKNIARAEDSWQKLYVNYTREHSGYSYWNFKKIFNFIGSAFIEKIFGLETAYALDMTTPSFRYDIHPTFTMYTKLSFILLDMYVALLNKEENLTHIFKKLSQQQKDEMHWINKNNPFKQVDDLIVNIAHNRLWDIGLNADNINAIIDVCIYLNHKNVLRKFIQDVVVLCESEKYVIDVTTGAKLKYNKEKQQYYYKTINKAQTELENQKVYDTTYVAKNNIYKRIEIQDICTKWKKSLQGALRTSSVNIKEPYKAKKGRQNRLNNG